MAQTSTGLPCPTGSQICKSAARSTNKRMQRKRTLLENFWRHILRGELTVFKFIQVRGQWNRRTPGVPQISVSLVSLSVPTILLSPKSATMMSASSSLVRNKRFSGFKSIKTRYFQKIKIKVCRRYVITRTTVNDSDIVDIFYRFKDGANEICGVTACINNIYVTSWTGWQVEIQLTVRSNGLLRIFYRRVHHPCRGQRQGRYFARSGLHRPWDSHIEQTRTTTGMYLKVIVQRDDVYVSFGYRFQYRDLIPNL